MPSRSVAVSTRSPSRHSARSIHRAAVADVVQALRHVARGLRHAHRAVEQRWKVSAAQLLVLQRLAEYPAPSVNDLAERTYTHQSTVSVVVSRLVRRGLVRRGRSGRDGRRTSLALTASGRALLDRAMNVSSGRLINALDSMSTARLRAMLSGLAHVVTALGTGTTPTDAHPTRAAGVGQLMRKRARPT